MSPQLAVRPLVPLSCLSSQSFTATRNQPWKEKAWTIIYRRNFQSHKQGSAATTHLQSFLYPQQQRRNNNETTCMHNFRACSRVNNVSLFMFSCLSLPCPFYPALPHTTRPTYLAPGQLTTNSTLGHTRTHPRTSWGSHACLSTAHDPTLCTLS